MGFVFLHINNKSGNLPSDMYTESGVFNILYGNKLKIEDVGGIITYTILDSKDNSLIENQKHFSTYQRWYFVSDTEGSVWVHSSDIGSVVYARSLDNKFIEVGMTAELCKKSPNSFKENLPGVLKSKWNCGMSER